MSHVNAPDVVGGTCRSLQRHGWLCGLPFVVTFNLVGTTDLLLDYYHASSVHLPEMAGQLGAAYVIPIVYVPALMLTHVVAMGLLVRREAKTVWTTAREATA